MRLIFHLCLLASIIISVPSSIATSSTVSSSVQNEALRDQHVSETPREATAPDDSTEGKTGEHPVTITYPSRLIYYLNEESESTFHDLDTRAKNQAGDGQDVHLAQASFQLDAFGTTFTLDLTLNNGMFDDGNFVYLIEPQKQTHTAETEARPHTLRRTSSLGLTTIPDDWTADDPDEEKRIFASMPWLKRRRKRAMPRNIFEEMKYLEIMIVADHNTLSPLFNRGRQSGMNRQLFEHIFYAADALPAATQYWKTPIHTLI